MTEKKPLLTVEEALSAILRDAPGALGSRTSRSRIVSAALWRATSPHGAPSRRKPSRRWTAMRCAPPTRLWVRFASSANPLQGAASRASAARATPCGSSPARRCPTAPTPSSFRKTPAATAIWSSATEPVRAGRNVRVAGVDFHEGAIILRAGRRLGPAEAALAAAADYPALPVARAPRVAVLSTGDELVAPGVPRGPDQIVSSNALSVLGLVAAAGGEALDLGIASDRLDEIEAAIGRARAAAADILVTIGGASVGDRDLVRGALAREGMELQFWKVNMKPGKPLIHGHIGPMRVIGLPGNPVSAAVCGELFLRPLIRALSGDKNAGADRTEPALAGTDLPAGGSRREYLRATLAFDAEGRIVATPQADQDFSLTTVLAYSEALVLREEKAPPCKKGEALRILRLGA